MTHESVAELAQAFTQVQIAAFQNIVSRKKAVTAQPASTPINLTRDQMYQTGQGFRLLYTITDDGTQFEHMVSGSVTGGNGEILKTECILRLAAHLRDQQSECKIRDAVEMQLTVAESGTNFLIFRLTPDQQKILQTHVL